MGKGRRNKTKKCSAPVEDHARTGDSSDSDEQNIEFFSGLENVLQLMNQQQASDPKEEKKPDPPPPGLLADKDYKPGDLIFTSEPYAFVVNEDCLDEYCHNCFKKSDNLRKCTVCRRGFYCNTECQKADWVNHKDECKRGRKKIDYSMSVVNPQYDVAAKTRLLARLIRKAEREKEANEWQSETVCGQKNFFPTLFSNLDKIEKQGESYKDDLNRRLQQIKEYLSGSASRYTDRELMEIMGKLDMNHVYISRYGIEHLGTALYLGFAMINHSCDPNACMSFNKNTLAVRAVKEIKRGQEITVAYIDVLRERPTRNTLLMDEYYFECGCSRCIDDPWEMDVGYPYDSPVQLMMMEMKRRPLGPSAAMMRSLEDLKGALLDWEDISHSHWVWYVRSLDVYYQRCYVGDDWAECVKWAPRLLKKLEYFYGKYSLIGGLRLMWYGEALSKKGRGKDALEQFKLALEVFRVCSGEGSWECGIVTDLMEQC